jgi:hypothetical protein
MRLHASIRAPAHTAPATPGPASSTPARSIGSVPGPLSYSGAHPDPAANTTTGVGPALGPIARAIAEEKVDLVLYLGELINGGGLTNASPLQNKFPNGRILHLLYHQPRADSRVSRKFPTDGRVSHGKRQMHRRRGPRDASGCDLIGKRGHTAPSLPRPGSSRPGDGLRPDRARGDRSHGRYDFVIIGSPVWAGRATPAINRRCSAHRMRRGRTIRMIRGTFNDEKMFTSAIAETRERRWAHRRPDRLRIWLMILGSRLIVIAGGEPLGHLEEILSSAGVHLRILLTVFANRLLIDARGRDRAAPEQSQLRELRRGDRQAPGDRGQRPPPSNLRRVEDPGPLLPARSNNPGKSPTRCLSADPGKSGARVPVVRAVPGEPGGPDGERGKVRRRR